MTNLFQTFVQKARSQKPSQPIVREQTHTELVDEIHETFYTEVDRLLDESKSIKAVSGEIMSLVEKEIILAKNGFYNTRVKIGIDKQVELTDLANENSKKIATLEAIRYFAQKYPQYKFITEDSIKKICQKYGLLYSEPSNYIGFVPEKNVKDISDFKIDPIDECFSASYFYDVARKGGGYLSRIEFEELKIKIKSGESSFGLDINDISIGDDFISYSRSVSFSNISHKQPMLIAAPIKDFDTTYMKVENFKLVSDIKDPVIFKPVVFKGYQFFLIVTAWGQEASDPMVVNERMN